jgi:23S rRNA (cytidine1920-2'-O)/16S rRNA (cytidine1409-2'-O)-methyltransferase
MPRASPRRGKISAPKPSKEKVRLDQYLLLHGLAESREKARGMIMAGLVEVNGVRVDKPGSPVKAGDVVSLRGSPSPYVSRGGMKLEAALKAFPVEVGGKVILDVGASTGGFTDCLLQFGAKRVISIDVGYGQLDWKMRTHPQVRVLEKTNIRYLSPEELGERGEGAVIDVSFISLTLVLPAVSTLLADESFVIALIKPQFEVGKGQVGKGGVVRDPLLHGVVVKNLTAFCESLGWECKGVIPSPLLGPKGNREFLICLKRAPLQK